MSIEWKRWFDRLLEGALKHAGELLLGALFTGYASAWVFIQEFRAWLRSVPTDYVLTPALFLLALLGILALDNFKQRRKLRMLTQNASGEALSGGEFVSHWGVWWKMFPDDEYIEDFPYCPCCEPKKKLVQTEWHPDEIYMCPQTKTTLKLYDGVPRERQNLLQSLYGGYFKGEGFVRVCMKEFRRLKALYPNDTDAAITDRLIAGTAMRGIPAHELALIRAQFQNPVNLIHFVGQNIPRYRQYMKRSESAKPS